MNTEPIPQSSATSHSRLYQFFSKLVYHIHRDWFTSYKENKKPVIQDVGGYQMLEPEAASLKSIDEELAQPTNSESLKDFLNKEITIWSTQSFQSDRVDAGLRPLIEAKKGKPGFLTTKAEPSKREPISLAFERKDFHQPSAEDIAARLAASKKNRYRFLFHVGPEFKALFKRN